MKSILLVNELTVLLICCWYQIPGIFCLRNVFISMPDAVEKDEKVCMVCKYNLEGETLYTLKWYKGEHEFFRYTPKESPSTKYFPMKAYPDLEIIREESYGDQVTLRRATTRIAGIYTCEVTTDIPSFHALSGHGELRVVVLPQELPVIKGYKPKIKEGEWTNITCISTKSIPSANLTWTINNKQVSGKHNIIVTKRVISGDDLEESKSNLYFQVTEKHFTENNSLKVRCTASIYSVYQKTTEISILPDRPNKFIYKPEVQANPFFITFSHNVKSSRSNNAPGTAVFNENNNNVIEAENLANNQKDKTTITAASICVIPVAIMMWLLC